MSTCQRFGCLPSQLMAEPGELLSMLKVEKLGRVEEVTPDGF